MVRKSVSNSSPVNGSLSIKAILKQEPDFNVALDKVVFLLRGLEPWRFKRKEPLSISEILVLKAYHVSIWGVSSE